MNVAESLEAFVTWRETVGGRLGLVPTMGALHDGHLSLVRRARRETDRVVTTIFVNPTQFGSSDDLKAYPRDLDRDLTLLREERVDCVFTPGEAMMYPGDFSTWVVVERLDRAYFGEKDYQQLRVVERLVRDLNVRTEIVPCPTVRESDGLAMSSRNVHLAPEDRRAALVLFRALSAARDACHAGEPSGEALGRLVAETIGREPRARADYVAVADPRTLEPVTRVGRGGAVCLLAVWVGSVRLIDNVLLGSPG